MKGQRLTAAFVFIAGLILAQLMGPQVQAGDDFDALTPEQAAFATRFSEFIEHMDSYYFDRIDQLNGGSELQTLTDSTEYSDYDVKVARGPVVEKAGRTIQITKKPTRDFQRENLWSRYFLFDVHPETPLVGMLHAAIVMQIYPDGTGTIAGFLDTLRTANQQEDLDYLTQAMDQVYEKHGVDAAPYRKLSREGDNDEDDPAKENKDYRRKTTSVGGSFYGRERFALNEESFSFLLDAYETMVVAYLDVVERRKDTPYTEEDLAAQDAMRKNWAEDRLFSDPYTTGVTPYEIWSLMSLPPEVKF